MVLPRWQFCGASCSFSSTNRMISHCHYLPRVVREMMTVRSHRYLHMPQTTLSIEPTFIVWFFLITTMTAVKVPIHQQYQCRHQSSVSMPPLTPHRTHGATLTDPHLYNNPPITSSTQHCQNCACASQFSHFCTSVLPDNINVRQCSSQQVGQSLR